MYVHVPRSVRNIAHARSRILTLCFHNLQRDKVTIPIIIHVYPTSSIVIPRWWWWRLVSPVGRLGSTPFTVPLLSVCVTIASLWPTSWPAHTLLVSPRPHSPRVLRPDVLAEVALQLRHFVVDELRVVAEGGAEVIVYRYALGLEFVPQRHGHGVWYASSRGGARRLWLTEHLLQVTLRLWHGQLHDLLMNLHRNSRTSTQQFYYLMKGSNMSLVPLLSKWTHLCNKIFEPHV